MPDSGLARARKRGDLGLRPSCRRQGAVRFAVRQNGAGEHDGLAVAVAPAMEACPAHFHAENGAEIRVC